MTSKPAAIDCDVHSAPPGLRALLPYLDDYWRNSVVERGIPSLDTNSYPPRAPLSARPQARSEKGNPQATLAQLTEQVFGRCLMAGHIVATVDQIPPGARKLVEVNGRAHCHLQSRRRILCPEQSLPAPRRQPLRGHPDRRCRIKRAGALSVFAARRDGEAVAWLGVRHPHRTLVVRSRAPAGAAVSGIGPAWDTAGRGPYVAQSLPVRLEDNYVVVKA